MAQLESASEITSVDDFYFSALFDESPFPISDSKYAEELQFQEALMSSSTKTTTSSSSSSSSVLYSSSSPSPLVLVQLQTLNDINYEEDKQEIGESSQTFCEICTERKPADEIFKTDDSDCKHSFCSDCIAQHVATRVQYAHVNNVISCPGPDCKDVHVLELEACRDILPKEVAERWDEALVEALILEWKFYCPFRDCSAVLVNDGEEGEEIVESECPVCHRLFCARCRVPWHSGIGCEEFGLLNEDERGSEDLMVRELAKEKKWKRCPKCMYYVERTEGCLHILCRCTFEFCYGCGCEWTQTHDSGCQRD